MSIMQPKDIALMEEYKTARKEFELAKTSYYAIRDKYNKNLDRLNGIFEPELNKVYGYMDTLTNDYLLNTPKTQVWVDMKNATGTNVSSAKFGRMMKEYAFYITTKARTGELTPTRHWRR